MTTENVVHDSLTELNQFFHRRFLLLFSYTAFMGGERASTSRKRLTGQICCNCKVSLPAPPSGSEAYCVRCAPRHKVCMHFMRADGWYCQFLEQDLKTSARKPLLSSPEKILDLARRGGADMKLEDIQAIEYAIATGRGSLWLNLTEEQYRKLKR